MDINIDLDNSAQVHMIMSNPPASDSKLEEIKAEIERDLQMRTLKQLALNGWPETKEQTPKEIQDYWNFRDEISVINDILLKGQKLIILHTLRKEMLNTIHVGHMGIEKSKIRARDASFWPGMCKDIEELIQSCDVCQELRFSNQKGPMFVSIIPTRAWEVVATDLFHFEEDNYLLVVEY